MEIDFLIQWKKKITTKTDIKSSIKSLLNQLFSKVTDDSFTVMDDNDSENTFNYKCSTKEDKGYLKISCNNSEAKAANLLANIRNQITKSKHRREFIIICTYDEASLSFSCRLMRPFGSFERHLRELMYLITVKAFGVDWVEKTIPIEMQESIKSKTKGKITGQSLTESAFEYLDYQEIIDYLFEERYFHPLEEVFEDELSEEKLSTLSKEEILSIISHSRKSSLWNRLFSQKEAISPIDSSTLNVIREYRNDIMHQHEMDFEKSHKMRSTVKQADDCVKRAITEMEDIIYTKADILSVSYLMGKVVSKVVQQYAIKIEFEPLNNIIATNVNYALNNLATIAEVGALYQKHITGILSAIVDKMPDYSSIIPKTSALPQETIDKLSEIARNPLDQLSIEDTETTDDDANSYNETEEEQNAESND